MFFDEKKKSQADTVSAWPVIWRGLMRVVSNNKDLYETVVLRLRALINQSSLVYADANTARLTLCPYQLEESGQQSIILHVTRHVVECRVCKQCVHSHKYRMCAFL